MKRENIRTERTAEEWRELVGKYFDALTTGQEERELKIFLSTPEADEPCFDEIKAVIGYFAAGRAAKKRKGFFASNAKYISIAAAAACIAIGFIWYGNNGNRDICIAYINGKECTDEALIMQQMKSTLSMISTTTEEHSVENRLSDIFSTINNKEE